jgi:hypothetical protein
MSLPGPKDIGWEMTPFIRLDLAVSGVSSAWGLVLSVSTRWKENWRLIRGLVRESCGGTNGHSVIRDEDWFTGLVGDYAIGDEAVEFGAYVFVT